MGQRRRAGKAAAVSLPKRGGAERKEALKHWKRDQETEKESLERQPQFRNTIKEFRCIGPACPETCCRGWDIPVNQEAMRRYRSLKRAGLTLAGD